IFSRGVETSCSTSAAECPGKLTYTSARGTTICGSSSRGVSHSAVSPTIVASRITTSERFDSRNVFTILFVKWCSSTAEDGSVMACLLVGCRFCGKDDLLPLLESRENFDDVGEDPTGTHRAAACAPPLNGVHKLELTDGSQGLARENKHRLF